MTKDALNIDLAGKTITIPDDVKTVMITLREEKVGETPYLTLRAAEGLEVVLVPPASSEGKPRMMGSSLNSDGTSGLSADVNGDRINDIYLSLPKGATTRMADAKELPSR